METPSAEGFPWKRSFREGGGAGKAPAAHIVNAEALSQRRRLFLLGWHGPRGGLDELPQPVGIFEFVTGDGVVVL